ncbi:hypothetical protein ACI2OW_00750 [Pseudomonas shirazica]|uniref:hypothetical protein n=1 Tax=Pseudomonas TaxID=286 RepID=UPI003852082D
MSEKDDHRKRAAEILKKIARDMAAATNSTSSANASSSTWKGATGPSVSSSNEALKSSKSIDGANDEFQKNALLSLQAQAEELGKTATFLKQAEVRISSALADSEKKLTEITNRIDEADESLRQAAETQRKLLEEVQLIKGSAVSALSVFVSFFAFITVSINVFAKAGSFVAGLALVFAFWCMLVGFNVMVGWQFNTLRNNGIAWFLLILVAIGSISSLALMYKFAPDVVVAQKTILEPPK